MEDKKGFNIGTYMELEMARRSPYGMYLAVPGEEHSKKEEVLLPQSQVPEDAAPGGRIRVFIYRDSSDRPIATLRTPLLTLGKMGLLKCTSITEIGAFLDMGLERDLLLPFHEQTYEVREGDEVLCAMYLDKSGRLAATMKVYPYLSLNSPYKEGDEVEGLVYEISRNFGAFVAVDMMFSARIPAQEFSGEARCGERIRARVTSVKEDGKLDISIRRKSYLMMDEDCEAILALMKEKGGFLPFTDKAAPEKIREECHMTKNAFKRAVGRLLKQRKIRIGDERIELI